METPTYPKFYRHKGICVRVDSPTYEWTIGLRPHFIVPCRMPTTYATPERMAEYLKGMEETTEEKYKEFYATFLQQAEEESHERRRKLDIVLK